MNGVYIRALPPEELVERALPFLLAGLPEDAREIDREYAARVIALDQERLKTLADAPRLTSFFFVEQPEYDPALLLTKGLDAERASVALEVLIDRFEALEDWTHEALLATLDGVVTELGFIRTKGDGTRVPDRTPIFMLVRVAVSGRKETPGLPETLVGPRQSARAQTPENGAGQAATGGGVAREQTHYSLQERRSSSGASFCASGK